MSPEGARYNLQIHVPGVTTGPERSRRIACSRCRGQKLRCERVDSDALDTAINSVGACKRCLKAGAKCDIGSHASQRPGRVRRVQRSPEGTRDVLITTSPTGRIPNHTSPRGHGRDSWSAQRSPQRRTSGTVSCKPKFTTSTQGLHEYNHSTFETPTSTGTVFSSSTSSLGASVLSEDGGSLQEPPYPNSLIFECGTNPNANSSDAWEKNVSDLLGMAVSGSQTVISTAGVTSRSGGDIDKLADGDDTDTFMHIDFDPQLPSDTPMTHGDQNQFDRIESGSPKPPDGPEQGVQKLLELSSSLLTDLSRISSGKLADNLSPSLASGPNGTSYRSSANEGSTRPYNAIGRIFNSSERFLDILKHFTPPPSTIDSPTRSSSVCSYSSDFDDDIGDNLPIVIQNERPQAAEDLGIYNRSRAPVIDTPASEGLLRPDIPTTLAILACYTYILRIYKTIFQQIHEHLLQLDQPSQPAAMLNTLPGLQLGGFHLDGHYDLQIEVLIHISFRILDTIHQTLGLRAVSAVQKHNGGSDGRASGILGGPLPAALLEIVLNQKGAEYLEGDAAGIVSLKATVERIRQLLRGTAV
jgi:Fungal Zn(2)-Cys(6) binuclear cluster domain